MTEMDFILPSFDNLPRSMFFPQNLPSLLAVESLELEPGLQVLDMCSSPGGKTSHIAQLTKNTGIIVAIDKNRSKIEKLRKNLEACGINHVKCIVADSSKINELDYVHKLDEESRKFLLNRKFDRVLLDPPCSGIGQRPIFQLENFSEIESSYSKYQMKLIDAAVDMLRPGGILVYSTCTVAPAENEGVISYAIRKHPLKLVEPSYSNYSSRSLEIFDLSIEEASLARRFWPYGGPSDTNGFFYAKLKKICDKY